MRPAIRSRSFCRSILVYVACLLCALIPAPRAQFPPPDGFDPRANNAVFTLATQNDGKILVGGLFSELDGHPRNCLARLSADGVLDEAFNPGLGGAQTIPVQIQPYVASVVLQGDGKILVGGWFTVVAGQNRRCLARLNPDGTPDAGFNPEPDQDVYALVLQPDGKILVGGSFTQLAGGRRPGLGRLNVDGSLDLDFNPEPNASVYALALQPDGKILAAGAFTRVSGLQRDRIARLDVTGRLDADFRPNANGGVYAIAVRADGRILLGGSFTEIEGIPRLRIAQLNPDGDLDSTFDLGANGDLSTIALQTDGKTLVGGGFTELGGRERNGIACLKRDGNVDLEFNAGIDTNTAMNSVHCLAVQPDGKVLVGGWFDHLAGVTRHSLGRLQNSSSASQGLAYVGSNVTWLRGGSSPEVLRVEFDCSTNHGITWEWLGSGTRLSNSPRGGTTVWRLFDVAAPAHSTIRARGFISGDFKGSGWFQETITGPPVVTSSPQNLTNQAGTSATFKVTGGGSEPLYYQWLRNGMPLAEGENIVGATNSTLTVRDVRHRDQGGYSVVLVNGQGTAPSTTASLTVIDPVIAFPPVGKDIEEGGEVSLYVTAVGTDLNYQWSRDGVALPLGTNAALSISNLRGSDAGYYSVEVKNAFGSVTSTPALVTVNTVKREQDFIFWAPAGGLYSLAAQADGNILVSGYSYLFDQSYTSILLNGLARLMPDNQLDPLFNPQLGPTAGSIILKADDKMLVQYLPYCMTWGPEPPRNWIIPLNLDGSWDPGFKADFDWSVNAIAVQPDGKVLVAGARTSLDRLMPVMPAPIVRLSADGTPESGFNPEIYYPVESLALQPDGKILVLSGWGGPLFRYHPNGSLERELNPDPKWLRSATVVSVQPDGKILVAESYTRQLVRYNADALLDASFAPVGINGPVYSMVTQADGKILIGGVFSQVNGQSRQNLTRLNADGSLDPVFVPKGLNGVSALLIQSDGRILAIDGDLVRLLNTGLATESLTSDGSTITWQRGGTGPAAWRTTFEYSTNRVTWQMLGPGSHIAGGWQLGGLTLPAGATIRARGFVNGGNLNGSSWFVETQLRLPDPPDSPMDLRIAYRDNQPALDLTGRRGTYFTIEYASSLSAANDWLPLSSSVITNSPQTIMDPSYSGVSQRFYRLQTGKSP
jgi:uncharacterized delta-60 repeat protein